LAGAFFLSVKADGKVVVTIFTKGTVLGDVAKDRS